MEAKTAAFLEFPAEVGPKRGNGETPRLVVSRNGNRVKATLGGVTTYYIGNHFEWRGSTSTMTRYYYADGQRIAMRQGSSTVYFLLGDHLGSTSITANSSGGKVAELRYHPWGGTRFSSGTTPTAWRYTGQIEDAAIGLYFYNARYYDPALGRFIQADTIIPDPANPQSLNRYAYTLNNPLKYVDDSGHIAILATAAAGAVIGGIVGGVAYLITTPQNQWNLGDGLLVAATGALAGGLIGTGVGAAAGATLASGDLMAASTAAIHTGAGVGIAVGGGSTLRDNHLSGEGFHAGEFMITSAAGGIGGAFAAGVPGAGLPPAVVRASASGSANMLGYVGAELAQGRVPAAGEAADRLIYATAGAFAGDIFAQGVGKLFAPNSHANPPDNIRDYFTAPANWDMRRLDSRDPGVLRNMLFAETASATRDLGREFVTDRLFQPR